MQNQELSTINLEGINPQEPKLIRVETSHEEMALNPEEDTSYDDLPEPPILVRKNAQCEKDYPEVFTNTQSPSNEENEKGYQSFLEMVGDATTTRLRPSDSEKEPELRKRANTGRAELPGKTLSFIELIKGSSSSQNNGYNR